MYIFVELVLVLNIYEKLLDGRQAITNKSGITVTRHARIQKI